MLAGQLAAHAQPGLVEQPATDHAVRSREVDELEDAQALAAPDNRRPVRGDAVGVDGQDLAGLDVAHHLGTHRVERRALRRHRPAYRLAVRRKQPAQGERPESHRIARRHQRALGEHGEGEGAGRPVKCTLDALRPGPARSVGDEACQHLGIRGGHELDALLDQLVA